MTEMARNACPLPGCIRCSSVFSCQNPFPGSRLVSPPGLYGCGSRGLRIVFRQSSACSCRLSQPSLLAVTGYHSRPSLQLQATTAVPPCTPLELLHSQKRMFENCLVVLPRIALWCCRELPCSAAENCLVVLPRIAL